MKQFKKMVEIANRNKTVLGYDDKDTTEKLTKLLFSSFEKNNVFVFSPIIHDQKYIEECIDIDIDEIDAPFPVFSIEISGNTPITSSEPAIVAREGFDVRILCFMIVEINPKDYIIFELLEIESIKGTIYNIHCQICNQVSKYSDSLLPFAANYLERLAKEKTGIQKVKESIKIKNNHNKKKLIKINSVIHVTPKSNTFKYSQGTSRKVNWSHRWSVRGHWMRVKGIGKDRDDNYCVEGFSWRRSYTKGPKDSPLINKQRLVK